MTFSQTRAVATASANGALEDLGVWRWTVLLSLPVILGAWLPPSHPSIGASTSASSGTPLCSPARAGLLTGRYPLRSGIMTALPAAGDSFTRRLMRRAGLLFSKLGSVCPRNRGKLDIEWLHEVYRRTRKSGAVGADGLAGALGTGRRRVVGLSEGAGVVRGGAGGGAAGAGARCSRWSRVRSGAVGGAVLGFGSAEAWVVRW